MSTSANLQKQTVSRRASSTEDGRVRKAETFVPEELNARGRQQSLATVHESYTSPSSPFGGSPPSNRGTFVPMPTPRRTSRSSPAPGSPLQPRPSLYSPKGIPAPLREPTPVPPTLPFSIGSTSTSSPRPSPLPNPAVNGRNTSWLRSFHYPRCRAMQDSFAGNYRIFIKHHEIPQDLSFGEIAGYLWEADGAYAGVQCYIPKSNEHFQCGIFFDPGILFPFFDLFKRTDIAMYNFRIHTKDEQGVFVDNLRLTESTSSYIGSFMRSVAFVADVGVVGMSQPCGQFSMQCTGTGLLEGRFWKETDFPGVASIDFEFYAVPCAKGTIVGPAKRIADKDFLRTALELRDMY
ncbi:hypothetical protein Moror_4467 [Moniliophthora roreri MCA 2997]|uniref:Uncharacterized protein n=1 Tax=Moniliophthora roreri (strain MCA 2997) TaxID=1381753 RepID=V2XIT1_MONRO|nr:hypothetical protein Moror_4467 [Moniliophthora roreri MCA 2997]